MTHFDLEAFTGISPAHGSRVRLTIQKNGYNHIPHPHTKKSKTLRLPQQQQN